MLAAVLAGGAAAAQDRYGLPRAAPEAEGFAPDLGARLRGAMQARVDQGLIPGALMAVARHGRVVAVEAVGWADVAHHRPVTPDTIYRLFSSTKAVTAAAALQLADRGVIGLDEPAARWLPALAELRVYAAGDGEGMTTEPLARPITVRDLLAHRAGFTYGAFGDSPVHRLLRERQVGMGPVASREEFIARLVQVPLLFQPGTRWEYGVSHDVLAAVIEKAAGMPFEAVLQRNIFDPLGLSDITFRVPENKQERLAIVYVLKDGKLESRARSGAPQFAARNAPPSGGGGLSSTAADFLRFAQMLLNGGELEGVRLMSPRTVDMIKVNQVPAGGPSFGLGVGIEADPAATLTRGPVGSYGWSGAGQTHFWIDPTERIVGIFYTAALPYTIDRDTEMRTIVYGALHDWHRPPRQHAGMD